MIKLFLNSYKYYQCKSYLNKYLKWLKKPSWELSEHKSDVIKLFKDAGLKDSSIQVTEQIVYSHLSVGNVSVFYQFPSNREEFVGITRRYFHQAIGVYRSRAWEVFNPFYWIEFIIYLPKQFLNYVGVSPESIIVKMFQLIYWSVATVLSILYALYTPEINMLVKEWISRLIS